MSSKASTARAISSLTVVFDTSRLSVQNVVESRRLRISPNGCMLQVAGQLGHRLLVRGQAHLDRDPLVGDELGQPARRSALLVRDPRVLDLGLVEEPRAVADAVGVAVADRLEDRLGAVVLAGVDGLAEERLVRDLVGLAVVVGGIALLLAREVDAHDQQPLLVAQPRGGARHLEAGRGVDLVRAAPPAAPRRSAGSPGENSGGEEAQRAEDDPGDEARLARRDRPRAGR